VVVSMLVGALDEDHAFSGIGEEPTPGCLPQ
jgi:hypothetical protein